MKFISLVAVSTLAVSVYASGPAAGCLQTYTVKDGDGCETVAASFGLTPDAFYAMNPGLHHAGTHLCDNFDTGKPYCVCMKKPCAQEKNVVASGVTTSANAAVSSAAASGSSAAASSAPASSSGAAVSSSASVPTVASGNASAAISGSAASASGSAAATPKSAGEKLVSSVAMFALLAGAASVLAL
ncbi:unnamed protein product [Umbelopsis vinacea]